MTLLEDLAIGLFVPNTGTVNQIRNPSGANGTTSGWKSFEVMALSASSTSGGPLDHGITGAKIIGTTLAAGGPVGYARTVVYPITAGKYAAVKYVVPYVDGGYRVGFQWVDQFGNDFGSLSQSAYRTASASQAQHGGVVAPVGAYGVRVVFWHYSNSGGSPAALNAELIFRDVKLGIGTSSAIALNIVDRGVWHDDLKPAHASLKITRSAMQPGLVAAALKSEQLPSGRDAQLSPGEAYRVLLGTDQLLEVSLTERGSEESSTKPRPLTALEGADVTRDLAMRPEQRVTEVTFGTPPIAPLWELFSDAEIPWIINGTSAPGAPMEAEGIINTNMKAIDVVVMTRDLNAPSYAWVDRLGRGRVEDLAHLSSTPAAVLDEAVYSQLVTGFNMDSCFNVVTISRITGTAIDGGSEPTYTVSDLASIEAWGERPVQIKTTETSTDYLTAAPAFLALNLDPVFQVLSVRIPLHKINNATIAKLDLYDLVTVENAADGINEDLRIVSIEHEITPRKWIMSLGFAVDGIAAIPQVLPDPPS